MKTAVFVRDMDNPRADARLYRVDPPLTATVWDDGEGSFRGGLDHAEALRNAGYEVRP